MKNKTQKILSIMLVLALVMGCFVTLVTPKANAAELPSAVNVPSTVRTLVNTHLEDLDEVYLSTFTADLESGNGLNGPIIIWWYYISGNTGDVYMLVASERAGKIGTAAILGGTGSPAINGGTPGAILGGVEKKAAGNAAYTLIKFANVWLTGTENIVINMENGWDTGQTIKGKVSDYFPQLASVRYWDGSPFFKTGDGPIGYSSPVLSGKSVNVKGISDFVNINERPGYTFLGWKTITGIDYAPGVSITVPDGGTDLYANWVPRTDLSYVVNYLEQGTGKVLADEKEVFGQTFGTDVTEYAIDIEGYNKVDPTEVTITIAVSGNVIDFYYTARTDLSYVVNYLEQGTDAVLRPQKPVFGQTFGTDVTEYAIDIEGYNKVDPTEVTITIAVSGNVITFYYVKMQTTLGPVYSSVTATNAGNRDAILAGLNPKNGNPYFNDKGNADTPFVVPNSNHFVYAELDRADLVAGVNLDMLVGNNYAVVGSAFVKLVDGNIEITINGKGTFGAIAFNKLPVFNNGNIHSQKVADLEKFGATTGFNHDNKAILPCPTGDIIYLYIHCSSIQFYV